MIISQEVKDKIEKEYAEWEEKAYGGRDKKHRQKFGQNFTPPILTIKMLEKFDDLSGDVLDPTCGAGRPFSSRYICWSRSKALLWYRA